MTSPTKRRLCVGAEVRGREGVHFRVWAPKRTKVEVVFEGKNSPAALAQDLDGYFSGLAAGAKAGDRYRFRLDGGEAFPDPASRRQPEGPHGPSEVVDPMVFEWRDAAWKGVPKLGQVIYEMHLGTFTPEGTWAAAAAQLPELARLGVTVLEVMPVAEFPGRFGWGYDGVDLFAPTHLYGAPDDARRFVDAAHAVGLGVILDVVYNHFGPDGNYLNQFSDTYFTDRHETDWGAALNYYGEGSGGVRDLILANARYWVEEFHFDGLRLDATQNIYDESEPHILRGIASAVREAAPGRSTFIAAENEPQEARLVRRAEDGGYGADALWNDDFHHTARVAMTGHTEAYYTDYGGTPQELVSALKWGYLYQGQYYAWQKQGRGQPCLDLDPSSFIAFLENHDQVANSLRGERAHLSTSPGRYRTMVALMLLAPSTPLLFQGQEFASSSPFLFFADHAPDLAVKVREGRAAFLAQFPSMASKEHPPTLAAPDALETFERCKLEFAERERHAETYLLYHDLIALRRGDAAFREPGKRRLDGAVLSTDAFVLRFFGPSPHEDRLVLVNLGRDLMLTRAPEPLLAPPDCGGWMPLWSSEDPRYGGGGATPLGRGGVWHIQGESALVLRAEDFRE